MHDYSEVKAILCISYAKLLLVISNLLGVLIQRLLGELAHQTGTSFLVTCRFNPLAVFNFGIRTVLKNISSMAHFLKCRVHVYAIKARHNFKNIVFSDIIRANSS
jgi:hypothetical protein